MSQIPNQLPKPGTIVSFAILEACSISRCLIPSIPDATYALHITCGGESLAFIMSETDAHNLLACLKQILVTDA